MVAGAVGADCGEANLTRCGPCTRPQTNVTIVGKNEGYRRENLFGLTGGGGDLAGAKFGTAKCGTAKLYHILPWY